MRASRLAYPRREHARNVDEKANLLSIRLVVIGFMWAAKQTHATLSVAVTASGGQNDQSCAGRTGHHRRVRLAPQSLNHTCYVAEIPAMYRWLPCVSRSCVH